MNDEMWAMGRDRVAFYTENEALFCALRKNPALGKPAVYMRNAVPFAWQFNFPRHLESAVSAEIRDFREAQSKGLVETQ